MSKAIFVFLIFLLAAAIAFPADILVQNDNGVPSGNLFTQQRNLFEESTVLRPDGPCKIKKLLVYLTGDNPAIDTIRICGYPTAGNLYPTQYIWSFNVLTPPIVFQYNGNPGWLEIDIAERGLRSDGFDRFVVTHIMRQGGPWFTYDANSRQDTSWVLDPFTPNPNFYNIVGTLYNYAPGDFMVRFVVEYTNPMDSTSMPPPPPSLFYVSALAGISGDRNSSVVDYNADGLDDISFSNGLYKNNGDGTFTKQGPPLKISNGGTAWGDFDNDGWPDVYAIAGGSFDYDKRMEFNKNKIYKNYSGDSLVLLPNSQVFQLPYPNPSDDFELGNKFANDTIHNPYNTNAPLWFDYNQDGYLDLFIANRRIEMPQGEIFCPDQLWKNNGNGTFGNTRKAAGIDLGEPFGNGGYYDCYGASANDYNNDGKVDLFVANYRLIKDNLYKNNGNETFTEVAASTGVQGLPTAAPQYFGHGMGAQWGDFNNDGFQDLCVGNLAHTDSRGIYSNPSLIFKNKGSSDNYTFSEQHYPMGLKFHEGNAGAAWLDLNLDGYLDLWHGKYSGGFGYFYLNEGPPDYKLRDMTWDFGAIVNNSWVAVYLDYDRDGDLDMIVEGRLFRNDIERKGNWVAFRLSGSPADKVPAEAYGSKVSVHCGKDTYYRELMGSSAGSLCTQNTLELHFGIGGHEIIDSVIVSYPNGFKNVLKSISPNAHYRIPYMQTQEQLGLSSPGLVFPANYAYNFDKDRPFEWTKCGGAEGYRIQVSDSAGFGNLIINELVNDFKFTGGGLTEGKLYFWRVMAENKDKKSAWSTVYSFVPGIPAPSAPGLVSPADDSAGIDVYTTFRWNASEYPCQNCGVTKYEILVYEQPIIDSILIAINEKGLTDTKFEVKPRLKPGTKYFWKVRGFNGEKYGEWPEPYSFTTTPLPEKANILEPADNSENISVKPNFKWDELPYAANYQIQIAKDQDFSNLHFDKSDITSNSYKVFSPKLSEGTEYYWHVRGLNNGGEGEWSETFKFKTEGETGIDDKSDLTDFEIYPNPAYSLVRISLSGYNIRAESIVISDLLGNECLNVKKVGDNNQDIAIDVNKLSGGVYFIRILAGTSVQTKKITIIK